MIATSRLTAEPKYTIFFGSQNIITIGKGMIRYWTCPQNIDGFANSRKPLIGRNAQLKQRREATFLDCCQTKTAIFVVSIDVSSFSACEKIKRFRVTLDLLQLNLSRLQSRYTPIFQSQYTKDEIFTGLKAISSLYPKSPHAVRQLFEYQAASCEHNYA